MFPLLILWRRILGHGVWISSELTMLLVNICRMDTKESFDSVIMDARKKLIINMLEDIDIYVMQRMLKMQVKGQGWNRNNICINIMDKLNLLKIK